MKTEQSFLVIASEAKQSLLEIVELVPSLSRDCFRTLSLAMTGEESYLLAMTGKVAKAKLPVNRYFEEAKRGVCE